MSSFYSKQNRKYTIWQIYVIYLKKEWKCWIFPLRTTQIKTLCKFDQESIKTQINLAFVCGSYLCNPWAYPHEANTGTQSTASSVSACVMRCHYFLVNAEIRVQSLEHFNSSCIRWFHMSIKFQPFWRFSSVDSLGFRRSAFGEAGRLPDGGGTAADISHTHTYIYV